MTENPEIQVSVIIPAHKRPQLLTEAVRSVLAQSFKDFELIIVDDDPAGSAQAVVDVVNDARIVYIKHGVNRGASAARNTGLGCARGRFIAFLDDDDEWHPEFLQKMMAAMAELSSDIGVVQCAVEFVGPAGACTISRPQVLGSRDVHEAILRGEKLGGIIGLVRREVFDRCGSFDESLPSAQDWDLWIRVSRHFRFMYIPDVLAAVRTYGERISADPLRGIVAREHILGKYAQDFSAHPDALRIHQKRLGKLNSLVGRWGESWRWFGRSAKGSWLEWPKILLWLLLERPFIPGPVAPKMASRYLMGAVFAAVVLTFYSQYHAIVSLYVINDDVCQHIWWMRIFREPGLFQNDLLLQYAKSLQNLGILILYKGVALLMDPVSFTKVLPFFLFPVTVWALFRLVFVWTKDAYTSLLCCAVFMVTPIYMQHMTGGHAHAFGYMFLLLFLSFFAMEKYRSAALVMLAATFFFPVIFILAVGVWLLSLCFSQGRRVWQDARLTVLAGIFLGVMVLAVKFFVLSDPLIGSPLSRSVIEKMPELTASGRWDVWPVVPVWKACVMFAERGLFIFQAGYKTFLPSSVKGILLGGHVLLAVLGLLAGAWWWRRRKEAAFLHLGALVLISVILYVIASAVILKLYAPDRYVAYSMTIVALVFIMIPAGMVLSSRPDGHLKRFLQIAALLFVVMWVPLIRNAGVRDYSGNKELYEFLTCLPNDSLIAAFPDTADGIAVFSKRSVFINEELSVALFDRYWETVKVRTFDFFGAYYADQPETAASFFIRNGVTHLVIERDRYSKAFLEGKIYFEPFDAWVKDHFKPGQHFYFQDIPDKDCLFVSGNMCVISADAVRSAGGL
jgi:glycosyltransferase involved in cell wall biosynthesis